MTMIFELDVERKYRNKKGYDPNQKSINWFFETESHTIESFYSTVVSQGWACTMKHQKRTPQQSGGILRDPTLKTPKHRENFVSLQVITGDDDRKQPGVIEFWRNDPFFACYGSAIVESSSSKPGAEKCHPTWILDKPITDYSLACECLRALWDKKHGLYAGILDSSIDPTNTIFNADDATVYRFDSVLPLDVFIRDVVGPYRERVKSEQEKQEEERAEYRAKLDAQKAKGETASADVKRQRVQNYYDAIFSNLANKKSDRHNGLIHAGSGVANIKATPWAAPYLDIVSSADNDAIQACHVNGYYDDHAHSNHEVLRNFYTGLNTDQATPLIEPLVNWTAQDAWIDFNAMHSNNKGNGTTPPKQSANPAPSFPSATTEMNSTFPIALLKKKNARGEQGHAELLTMCYRNRACYDNAQKTWYIWNGSKWQRDDTGHFHVLAANQLGRQYDRVASYLYKLAGNESDDEARKSLHSEAKSYLKTIHSLHGRRAIKNVLEWAQAKPNLGILGDEWDVAPGRLPCENGIVDLATGDFVPMTPGDYIQKMAPSKWEGLNTPAPKWEQFIADIFDNDTKLISFVQRLLGYALLGEPREQIFPIFWGSGGNGKSTLCSAIEHVCGPLGGVAHRAVITQAGKTSNPSTAQPYLMDLRGKRYAFVSETSKDIAIDEAQLKLVSGGDYITARYLNENPITFAPTHTVFLLTNPKPRLDADDEAIWRRVFLVPFTQVFKREIDLNDQDAKEADPELAKSLQSENSGILAWLVRGAMSYLKDGLKAPDAVLDATKAYREENDSFSVWIEENCKIDDKSKKVKSSTALKNYNEFCKDQGMDALTAHMFRAKMKASFGATVKEKYGRYYYGVAVLHEQVTTPPTEPDAEPEPDDLPDIMFSDG